jgi:endonuclease/exonuclease/phosphatase family metal-dependent hydrolase
VAAPNCFGDDFFTFVGEPLREAVPPVMAISNAAAMPRNRIRIASYNIEMLEDGRGDGPERTPEIAARHARMAAELVAKVNADILLIQETENGDVMKLLNDALPAPYPFGFLTRFVSPGQDDIKMNIGAFSRFAVEDPTEIDFGPLTGPGRPTRGLFRFAVNLGDGRKLLVYTMHLKSNFGNKKRNIAQRAAALNILRADADAVIAAAPDAHWEIVAAGDTNVDPDRTEFANDTSFAPLRDWVDVWRQAPAPDRVTVPTRIGDPTLEFPPAAFDRFFVSPEMTNAPWTVSLPKALPEGCETDDSSVLPGTGRHVSDHYPVWIDLSK